jgi:hypothetical protein
MADSSARIVDAAKKAKDELARIQTPFIGPKTLQQINDELRQGLQAAGQAFEGFKSVAGSNAIPPLLRPNPDTGRFTDGPGTSEVDSVQDVPDKEEVIPGTTSTDTGTSNIPPEFLEEIQSKENPFKGFATMTYAVSLYLMGSEQYNSMISTGIKSVQGLDLLLQSGGITNDEKSNHGARRSPFFNLDFFIDDIELKGLVSGTSVNSPHNTFEMAFTITEPNGLSFLERLHAAVQDHNVKRGVNGGRINYAAQNYLMVVRFYGYDELGNRISSKDLGIEEVLSSTDSVSEKFIPFQFTDIQFSLRDEVVRYACKAVCPQTQVPFSVAQATIPFNLELSGQTVKSLLVGKYKADDQAGGDDEEQLNADESTNSGAEEAQEADAPSLIESLNSEQVRLVKTGKYEVPNEYLIEFEKDSGIGTAKVASPGVFVDKERASMSKTTKAQHDLLVNKGFFNKESKMYSITAGQPIVQVLDTLLRTSNYISDQQDVVIDEVTGNVTRKKPQKVFQWFKIRTEIKPLKYDNIRNDYAYRIKYVVSRYFVNNVRSPYFPSSKFRGVHKEYDYWFTGKNTEVLSFTQDYNYLYYQTFGGDTRVPLMQNNARELTKRYYQNSSSESSQGGKKRRNEPAANAASLLYSPADQASAIVEIVGDPDWIAQSEIFYSPTNSLKPVAEGGVGLGPFMQDGSVNYDSSEILFSINYNTNVDYNLQTGLADVGSRNFGRNLGSGEGGVSRISLIYRANTITTHLSGGAFKQTLEGSMMLFPTKEQLEQEEEAKLEALFEQAEFDDILMQGDMVYDYDLDDWVFEQELDDSDFELEQAEEPPGPIDA